MVSLKNVIFFLSQKWFFIHRPFVLKKEPLLEILLEFGVNEHLNSKLLRYQDNVQKFINK